MTESSPHSPLLDLFGDSKLFPRSPPLNLFGDSKVFQLTLPFNLSPTRPDLPTNEHTPPHVSPPIGRFSEGQPPRNNDNGLLTRDYHRSLRVWHVNKIPRCDHGEKGTSYFPGQDEINSKFEWQRHYRSKSCSESSDFFNPKRTSHLEEAQSSDSSKSPEIPRRRCSGLCPGRSDFFNVHTALDIENTHRRRSEPCPDCSDFFNASRPLDQGNQALDQENQALDQENQRRRRSEPFPSRLDLHDANGASDVIEPSHTYHTCNEDEHDVKERECSSEDSFEDPDIIKPGHTNQMCDKEKYENKMRKRSPEAPEVTNPSGTNQICDEDKHKSEKRKLSPEEPPEAAEATNSIDTNHSNYLNQMCNEKEHGSKKRKRSPEVSPGAQPCRPEKRRRITLNG